MNASYLTSRNFLPESTAPECDIGGFEEKSPLLHFQVFNSLAIKCGFPEKRGEIPQFPPLWCQTTNGGFFFFSLWLNQVISVVP